MSTIALRCDADERTGTGHAMRCLALAEAVMARGARAVFVSRALPAAFAEQARRLGAEVRMLPADPAADASGTRALLSGIGDAAWLVADSYALDLAWEQAVLAGLPARLAVIDDHASRAHACELLIDHNVSARAAQYDGRLPASAMRLIGPHYALLRRAFARQAQPPERDRLRRLHVAFGGADPTRETEKVLQALATAPLPGVSVDVVVGPANPRLAAIHTLAATLPGVELHVDVQDMAALLRRADLAVGAAGVSALERCACGVASLLVVAAANQAPIAQVLAERGAAVVLGLAGAVQAGQIASALASIAADPGALQRMAVRAAQQCDGHGARRVATRLLAPELKLRAAAAADMHPMLQWRNHESTRRHAHSPAPIDAARHEAWFRRRLADAQGALLVAEDARGAVGVLRYDIEGDAATVSIYLVPDRHGESLGSNLLRTGHAWLRAHRPGVRRIEAEVLPGNIASRRAFEEAGYAASGARLSHELLEQPT